PFRAAKLRIAALPRPSAWADRIGPSGRKTLDKGKRLLFTALAAILFAPTPTRAGLHYSGETPAELPANWRGFLLDVRALRMAGVTPTAGAPLHLLREEYAGAAAKLEELAKKQSLSADETADLGALHVRLGQPAKAVEILRPAVRAHPD